MINLLESINVQTNVPLDSRTVVKTLANRDSISSTVRYLGMKVYVSDEKKEYRLEDGIENSHWKEIKGITNLSEMVSDNNHMTVSQTEKDKWDSKAEGTHTHQSSEVTGLPESLKNPHGLTIQLNGKNDVVYDGSAIKSVNITADLIGAQPSGNYATSTHNHDGVYQPVGSYANSTHKHTATDITQDTTHRMVSDSQISDWGSKAAGNHNHDTVYSKTGHAHAWGEITGKPETFAPATHKHDDLYYTETEVNNLLSGKAPATHTHTASQVSGLPTSLKNPTALSIQLNGGTANVYDGSAAKSINITAASIGAQVAGSYAAANHNHSGVYQPAGSYAAASHTHNYLANNTSGTLSGNLTVTGTIVSNNNITAYSDETVKKNLVLVDNSVIEKLKKVKFYNYEMINDPDNIKRVGVKAQELKELFPELVSEDANGILKVDYVGLNTYFSFAMQQSLIGKGE